MRQRLRVVRRCSPIIRFGQDQLVFRPGDERLPERRRVARAVDRGHGVRIERSDVYVIAAVPVDPIETEVLGSPWIVARVHQVDQKLPGDQVDTERRLRELEPYVAFRRRLTVE